MDNKKKYMSRIDKIISLSLEKKDTKTSEQNISGNLNLRKSVNTGNGTNVRKKASVERIIAGLRGNNNNFNDGCSRCTEDGGWRCPGNVCVRMSSCGRGVFWVGEECDDGSNVPYDGCNGQCNIEEGFSCVQDPGSGLSICTEICGDGKKQGYHACDDGNKINGDGCSDVCSIEAGYRCSGGSRNAKDYCAEIWNDGLDFGEYECDDGNFLYGDGCD